jgi:hypothetical protein
MFKLFDLQLFADDSADGYTIDQAAALLSGESQEAATEETTETNTTETQEQNTEKPAEEKTEEAEETPAKVDEQKPEEESPAPIDYNLKVKFKANGQEVEKSIQDLINDAQLASNYNRRMQEMAEKEKAFNAALQQNPPQPQPGEKIKSLQQRIEEYRAEFQRDYGEEFNEYDPLHMTAFFDASSRKQAEELSRQQNEQAQLREYYTQEERYNTFWKEQNADPNYSKVNEYAQQAFFQLPQKGPEGIAQFQKLYPVYQKIQERLAWEQNPDPRVKVAPFTAAEVNAITAFYADAKKDYYAKQTKETVKAAVPKSVPIKPTVKVESTGDNTPAPAKKIDLKKVREMDLDEIAKML